MYVDNCITSVDSVEELESFQRDAKELLAMGKFDLRGWLNSEESGQNFERKNEHQKADLTEAQVLGLAWNLEEDSLSVTYRETETKGEFITKRKILSLAHRIFHPIGVTCPITLISKLLLQECWKIGASWDSKFPLDIGNKFESSRNQLVDLENIIISRKLLSLELKNANLSLHIFCDASKLAYATCVFLRTEKGGEVTCQLIQARSKVALLKGTSIPRLELLACTIGVRLVTSIKKDLNMEDASSVFWTDSMDVLYWIKKEGHG
ncbi:uncharacterized protein LOC118204314 [Stegodyphus dumicola]|uniref:uncharacterized protein LOC118204314 n=1 Tax=Stegodyphus dumicola TaxID=202533 RepID=UPI0015A8167B|nr:uncharacterized protein LOC118204314 [Stegodyphus dumicola]